MGLENDVMCGYLSRSDVFADYWNGVCFGGEPFLSGFRKEDRLIPVATIVFYHGAEEYDGCLDLHGMLKWNRENEKFKR